MFFNLLVPLSDDISFFNLFRYLTFRSGGAVMTALVVSFLLGEPIIRWLKSKQPHVGVRADTPETHLKKRGTPIMGGVLILLSMGISTLLWADLSNGYVWAVLTVTFGFGAIGFCDDYLKLTKRNSKGLPGRWKLLVQFLIAFAATLWIVYLTREPLSTQLAIPFFKNLLIDMGMFFIPFAMFVMVGSSNAVNLTDGLDGLAIVPVMIAAGCFAAFAYVAGNAVFANYLLIHHVPGSGELAVLCAALVGAALGFLWFNAPPAMVFMGDVGSLSMGGALGTVAVITKNEFTLAIVGGLFVLEAVSVIVQVASFKLTGKRVFLMAPLHHHFEKKGWAEPTIVIRFWIIASILALAGLATLKLR
ncbi:MAG: phospho-N-acetylmuramoyl-pentapeptide-transferase [Alphaproteobacteria bacterium]|nr:phospho-N-acetylmuramoyl-pentapeptide-transferase [Alphaproteobacteria bacterium]MCA0450163.1 phospho-N-acetylmuramoyl-pentapeptide-transferase [Pseudomonadota bacterium]